MHTRAVAVQRVVVTHRRAHPVWAFIGVLVVLGALVRYWYVALAVVLLVVAVRAERRLQLAATVRRRVAEDRRRTEEYQRRRLLTAEDRAWLGSHGWTG